MERIAKKLQKDPLEIKLGNMEKMDSPLPNLIKELQQKCDYATRKAAVDTFNQVQYFSHIQLYKKKIIA